MTRAAFAVFMVILTTAGMSFVGTQSKNRWVDSYLASNRWLLYFVVFMGWLVLLMDLLGVGSIRWDE